MKLKFLRKRTCYINIQVVFTQQTVCVNKGMNHIRSSLKLHRTHWYEAEKLVLIQLFSFIWYLINAKYVQLLFSLRHQPFDGGSIFRLVHSVHFRMVYLALLRLLFQHLELCIGLVLDVAAEGLACFINISATKHICSNLCTLQETKLIKFSIEIIGRWYE